MAKTKRTMELNAPERVDSGIDVELVSPLNEKKTPSLSIEQLTPTDFEKDTLLKVYRTMLVARRLDEKMITLLKQGKGFFHIGCAGHEAAQAAIAFYSRPGYDWFVPYYRDLCTALSLGQTTRDMLLAHLAKADDPNSGGRQMAEHFSSTELNILTTSSSVGAQYLPALGASMAMQRSNKDGYVYVSSGDGATSQGDFHEALNWATRIKAPILFFVQDNKYAISVPVSEQTAGGSAYKFGAGYEGIVRARVDGTDFFKTVSVAKAALQHIRQGHGPVLMVADVVRLLPHSSSDNHSKYRTPEELEQDRRIDPIARMELSLIEAGLLTESRIQEMRQEVRQQIDE
jgi:2-oxoisovalerate dehydrogenase E1 component